MLDKLKKWLGIQSPNLPEEDMWDRAAKEKGFQVVRDQLKDVVVVLNVSPAQVKRHKEYLAKQAMNHPNKK